MRTPAPAGVAVAAAAGIAYALWGPIAAIAAFVLAFLIGLAIWLRRRER